MLSRGQDRKRMLTDTSQSHIQSRIPRRIALDPHHIARETSNLTSIASYNNSDDGGGGN